VPPVPQSPPPRAPPPKEIALKNPAARPVLDSIPAPAKPVSATPPVSDTAPVVIHHSGVSFLHIMAIIALLVLSIIMQVISRKTAEKHYVDLANRITRLESKIPALLK